MTTFGITGKYEREGNERLSKTAEKSSFWLWWGRAYRAGSDLQTGKDLANHCLLTTLRTFQDRNLEVKRLMTGGPG